MDDSPTLLNRLLRMTKQRAAQEKKELEVIRQLLAANGVALHEAEARPGGRWRLEVGPAQSGEVEVLDQHETPDLEVSEPDTSPWGPYPEPAEEELGDASTPGGSFARMFMAGNEPAPATAPEREETPDAERGPDTAGSDDDAPASPADEPVAELAGAGFELALIDASGDDEGYGVADPGDPSPESPTADLDSSAIEEDSPQPDTPDEDQPPELDPFSDDTFQLPELEGDVPGVDLDLSPDVDAPEHDTAGDVGFPAPEMRAEAAPGDNGDPLADATPDDLRVEPVAKRNNPFLNSSTDPRERAERLARTLVSDMIAYAPEEHQTALEEGVEAVRNAFGGEIEGARSEFEAQVDEEAVPDRDALFRDAVNDVLGRGQAIL